MTLSFLALSMAPLTKLAALQFTVPLFGTLLAFLILREVVCARRITALAIGILGSLGTVSNICFARAFKESEVKVLTAIEFTRLIWSALIGYLAFAEVPATETWIGAVITIPASTYIILRERHLRKRPST